MAKRSRNIVHEFARILHDRSRTTGFRLKALTVEEYQKKLEDRLRYLNELCISGLKDVSEFATTEYDLPINKEDATYRLVVKEMNSLKRAFLEGFRIGFKAQLSDDISKHLTIALIKAYYLLRFKNAWSFSGYAMNAYIDNMYTVVCEDYEELLNALYLTCKYADRFVKLVEEYRGINKSMAHEYCSWLRRLRCHLSQISIRITPLSMLATRERFGRVYVAVHMDARDLEYNPYARRIYGLPAHYSIILRRKPDISFSTHTDGGFITARFNHDVISARDFADRPYAVRKLAELLLRPYLIVRDKARALGMPENAHNISTCSIYFIPRSTKSDRLRDTDNPTVRILSKPRIYFRQPII